MLCFELCAIPDDAVVDDVEYHGRGNYGNRMRRFKQVRRRGGIAMMKQDSIGGLMPELREYTFFSGVALDADKLVFRERDIPESIRAARLLLIVLTGNSFFRTLAVRAH